MLNYIHCMPVSGPLVFSSLTMGVENLTWNYVYTVHVAHHKRPHVNMHVSDVKYFSLSKTVHIHNIGTLKNNVVLPLTVGKMTLQLSFHWFWKGDHNSDRIKQNTSKKTD